RRNMGSRGSRSSRSSQVVTSHLTPITSASPTISVTNRPRHVCRGRFVVMRQNRRGLAATDAVVGSLFGDDNIVRMRLTQARISDANKLSFLQIGDGRCADVAHRLTQASCKLEDRVS